MAVAGADIMDKGGAGAENKYFGSATLINTVPVPILPLLRRYSKSNIPVPVPFLNKGMP